MVVKDTRIVKKAAPERTPLRRVCNSPRSENKLSSKAIEVLVEGSKENKPVAAGSSPAQLQMPHYLLPTINSCNQTRVNAKPLDSPSVISKVKKSSQSEACKYGNRNVKGNSLLTPDVGKRVKINGLRPSGPVEKAPVKNDRLKASMVVDKTPLKNNRFKPSGAVEKTPVENHRVNSLIAVEKTPGRASCSKIKVARTTCSSRCKHVVKDGDSKVSPKPRCTYAYCSLNHLEGEALPSVKQFLASRRRLLRTQKSFKWVGLTPVPKSVEKLDDGAEKENGVDTGQGLGADVLELCVEIYVNDIRGNDTLVGGGDSCDNCVGGMNDLGKLSANDPKPIVYESMDCDNYDDGLSMVNGSPFGSSASHEDDRLEILESQFDLSDLEVKADVSTEQLTETEFEKDDNYGLDADVSAYDVEAGYWGECDQTKDTEDHCIILPDAMVSQSDFDESDLGVNADDSMKDFAGVEDVKDENHGLDVEASTHDVEKDENHGLGVEASTHDVEAITCYEHNETEDNEGHSFISPDALGSQFNFDESDLRVEADDSMKQFAEVEVVKDDNHGLDVDASDVKADETEDVQDYCSILPNAMGPQCQFDELDVRVEEDDSMKQFAKTEVVKDDNHGLDVYASIHDVDQTEDTEDHCFILPDAMVSQSDFEESDLGADADDSMKYFAGVEDVKDENHGLDVEASTHDVEASSCYEHNETEDNEGHSFIPPDALGSQFNFDESDLRVEADDSMKQIAEVKVVKDDNHRLDVDASDVKADETEDVQDHCSILPNAMGPQCQFNELDVRVEEYDSMKQFAKAEVVKDDNHGRDVYASIHDVEADETEDGEDHCFIPPTTQGPQCHSDELDLSVKADDSMKQFAEAEVVKDDNHGLDVYASIHDVETDETEDGEDHCFIPPNAQGLRCQFDEVDIRVEADDSMKQFAEAEVVKDDNLWLDVYASVHDVEAGETVDSEDHCFIPPNVQGPQCQFHELDLIVKADGSLIQYAEIEDVNDDNHVDASAYDVEAGYCYEYSETEDGESRCFIPPNALDSQCIGHPESDGLLGGSSLEFDSCHKDEMKEECNTVPGILGNGSVSEVTVNDYTQQFADFENDKCDNDGSGNQISAYESMECSDIDYTPSGDSELCYFIQVDTSGLEHGSSTELDSPPNGSDTEPIASLKQGIEMECTNIAKSPLIELDINISGDNLSRKFSEIENGKNDCKSGIDVIANENEGCNNSNCSDSSDNESHCSIQVDSPEMQSTEHTETDSPVYKLFFELSANPEYEVIEDTETATSGQSESPFEVSANDFEKECTECENSITQKVPPSTEYDACRGSDSELCYPAREEDFTMHCDSHIESGSPVDGRLVGSSSSSNDDAIEDCSNIAESSLEGLVAGCESVEGDLKEYNHIAQENLNNHHAADSRLVWRRRHARHFGDQISDAEKVDLRHQMIEERKAAHEWMLDYALTQVVKKLSPFRQRKVELLVEAFETVTPISKCETKDLQHDAIGFAHLRPMQACG